MNVGPLLAFIRDHESNDNYDIVWAGIRPEHRPPKRLTTMTIREVLAWQESIDALYRSEAAGAYQILEDTLRGLYRAAGLTADSLFDRANQDKLAIALLKRRGLDNFVQGFTSVNNFCNELAKEWASLPVVTNVNRKQGAREWVVPAGASYYAGDGLNAARTNIAPFLAAVKAIRATPATSPEPERKPEPHAPVRSPEHWLVALFAAIAAFFGGKK